MASAAFMITTLALMGVSARLINGQALLDTTTIEHRFHEEVRGYAGKGPQDPEFPAIRKALEPMWLELSKNEEGMMLRAEVHAALSRFVEQRYGWQLDGGVSQSSPGGLSKEQVPMFLVELCEEVYGQTGLMIHELTLVATTLDHLVREHPEWAMSAEEPEECGKKHSLLDGDECGLAMPGEMSLPTTLGRAAVAFGVLACVTVAAMDAFRRFAGSKICPEKKA